jgi:predicted phosphatase
MWTTFKNMKVVHHSDKKPIGDYYVMENYETKLRYVNPEVLSDKKGRKVMGIYSETQETVKELPNTLNKKYIYTKKLTN